MRVNEWQKRDEMKETCGSGLKWEMGGREIVDRKQREERKVYTYCISGTYYAAPLGMR
jgi:hypothetical protein